VNTLLGPVEELAEEIRMKDVERQFMEENLRKLEETDWIVVLDRDIDFSKEPHNQTFLYESDYMAFFDQMNFYSMFKSFVEYSIQRFKLDSDEPQIEVFKARHLVRLFAVANQLLASFSRATAIFSARQYPMLVKRIAQTVIGFLRCLNLCIKESFSTADIDSSHYLDEPLNVLDNEFTTIRAELDRIACKVAILLMNFPKPGVWPLLLDVDWFRASVKTRYFITLIILGKELQQMNSLSLHDLNVCLNEYEADIMPASARLSVLLLANPTEGHCLLGLLVDIICQFNQADAGHSNIVDGNHQNAYLEPISKVIAKAIFHVAFLNMDHKETQQSRGSDFIGRICKAFPGIISSVVLWSREKFSELSSSAIILFKNLPLHTWKPSSQDMQGIYSMLKDPPSSMKFHLAKSIISRLNWDYTGDELAVPRTIHRQTAIAIANLYLDRGISRESQSIYRASATLASTALAMLVPNLSISGEEEDFGKWCWYVKLYII
jgi:hypothetical protein